MKLTPVAGPAAVMQTTTNETAAKAKAVAAFNAGKSSYDKPAITNSNEAVRHAGHSIDPNNVSVEELTAVNPPSKAEVAEPAPTEDTTEQLETQKQEKDPALSRQFAQLARQERQLRLKVQQEMAAIKQQKAELQAQQEAIKSKETEYKQGYISKDELKRNALQTLLDAGVTYDELTQQILSQQSTDPNTVRLIKNMEDKIAKLEGAIENNTKVITAKEQEQRTAAVKQIELDAIDTIRSNPIAYEAISKIGKRGVREVVKLIVDTYDKDGRVISVEDAANEIENYLIEENYKMASSISKIKRRLAEAGTANTNKQQTQANKQQTQTMKTLTNAAASSRKLTSKERAILAFKGELKP